MFHLLVPMFVLLSMQVQQSEEMSAPYVTFEQRVQIYDAQIRDKMKKIKKEHPEVEMKWDYTISPQMAKHLALDATEAEMKVVEFVHDNLGDFSAVAVGSAAAYYIKFWGGIPGYVLADQAKSLFKKLWKKYSDEHNERREWSKNRNNGKVPEDSNPHMRDLYSEYPSSSLIAKEYASFERAIDNYVEQKEKQGNNHLSVYDFTFEKYERHENFMGIKPSKTDTSTSQFNPERYSGSRGTGSSGSGGFSGGGSHGPITTVDGLGFY